MIEKHQVDNGNFILPAGAQYPDWVIDRINKFKEFVYSLTKEFKEPDKKFQEEIVKALEMFIMPKDIKITKTLNKPEIEKLVDKIDKVTTDEDFPLYIWLLMNAGFYLSTIMPICIDEDSLTIPDQIISKRMDSIKKFKETGNKQTYLKEIEEISKEVFQYMLDMDNAFGLFLESKANGSLEHIQELLVGVGLAMNSKGEIIDTVTNCLVEGVTQTQYFSKGSTGIVALYAKSSETAKPGYLGKKLSNICEKVKLAEDIDCGTKKLLSISTINPNFLKSFIGQYFSEKNNADRSQLKEFTKDDVNKYVNKTIYFRSPLYCKSQGHNICQTCYNQEFIRNHSLKKGDNIGLFTSTGMTGSLVNLTLKKSHLGINIKTEKVNFLKDLGING